MPSQKSRGKGAATLPETKKSPAAAPNAKATAATAPEAKSRIFCEKTIDRLLKLGHMPLDESSRHIEARTKAAADALKCVRDAVSRTLDTAAGVSLPLQTAAILPDIEVRLVRLIVA